MKRALGRENPLKFTKQLFGTMIFILQFYYQTESNAKAI